MFKRLFDNSIKMSNNINKELEYYEKNKLKKWKDWLSISKIFTKQGKQGLTGIMKLKEDEDTTFVFKLSQNIDYLVYHEKIVMSCLNEIAGFCHNFCKYIGSILCDVDPNRRKAGNPFESDCKYSIEKEVLLMQNIENACQFSKLIRLETSSDDELISIVKQVLLAVSIAQKKKQFTHYDLHSNNILIKQCNTDLVFLYIIDKDTQFYVSSSGFYPVIIDFGFSYCQDNLEQYYYSTFNHTDAGFYTDRFDEFADPKLFLITSSDEIHTHKQTRKSNILYNISRNIFSCLKLDWDSGWDNYTSKCANDYVLKVLSKYNSVSKLFKEYEYYFLDIINTLIVLPLEEHKYTDIEIPFQSFLKEFVKIENEFDNAFYSLYILKSIVDITRVVRNDYQNPQTREEAIKYFKRSIYERIDSVSKFCKPQSINFETMLCSLLCLTRCIEGMLYDTMEYVYRKQKKIYKNIPLKNIDEIYTSIDVNIPDKYKFNEKTIIKVFDCIDEKTYYFNLDEKETDDINKYKSITKGTELYKIFISKYK